MAKNKNKNVEPAAEDTSLDAQLDLLGSNSVVDEPAESDEDEVPATQDEPAPVQQEVKNEKIESIYDTDDVSDGGPRRLAPIYTSPEVKRVLQAPTIIEPTVITAPENITDRGIVVASLLPYPADKWGLTGSLKSAIAEVASRIAGDPTKKALVDEVLKIGLAFLDRKFAVDNELRGR